MNPFMNNSDSDKVTTNIMDNPFSFFDDAPEFDLDAFLPKPTVSPPVVRPVSLAKIPNPMLPKQPFVFPANVTTGNLVTLSEDQSNATTRGSWRIIAHNTQVLGDDGDMALILETRSNRTSSETVETELFSSINYELRQRVDGIFTRTTPFLLCRLQVVDPASGEEIRKNNKTILAGACESTLSPNNRENNQFETTIKFKFTDVSYHHDRRPFALRVSLFLNSNTDEPILIKQSEPIMVFARKKGQIKKNQGGKRKASERLDDEDESSQPVTKIAKPAAVVETNNTTNTNNNTNMNHFHVKLEALFAQVAQMSPQDKAHAVQCILQKMYEIDPEYNLFFQPPQIGFAPSFAEFGGM